MKNPIQNQDTRTLLRSVRGGTGLALGLIAVLAYCLAPPSAIAVQPSYELTVVTGLGDDPAGVGEFSNDFEPSAMNSRGMIAFTAEPDPLGQEAVFIAQGGSILEIMQHGQNAPGGGVFSFGEFGGLGLNDFGDVSLAFSLEPYSTDFNPWDSGVYFWSHLTHTLSPVVVPNVTPAPQGGTFLGANYNAALNNRGDVGFSAFLNLPGGPQSGAYLRERSGRIVTLAAPGDPAPGGGTFVYAESPWINDGGDAVFGAHLTTHSDPTTLQLFIRSFANGKITPIPLPAGTLGIGSVGFNNRGDVVFGGASVPFTVALGLGSIYLYHQGVLTTIASTGKPATPGDGNFSVITGAALNEQAGLNARGDVVFEAATDTGDEAIFLYSSATQTLRRVAGIGDEVAGFGTITSLEQGGALIFGTPPPLTGVPISNAVINDRGQIAFAATAFNGTHLKGMLVVATPTGTAW